MQDLSTGNPGKLIFNFAVPMLIGNVFQQIYNVTDSIIVGKFIGKEALAAVGASFPIIFALISLIIGVASGTTIIVAQYFGAKDYEKVRRAIDTTYIFLFFASLIAAVLGILFGESIFRITRLPEEIIPLATTYLKVYMSGMVFFFGFNGTSSILRGLGDSKTPLYFLIISTIANVFLDLFFIVVLKMGVAGAALATVIAQAGAFATATIYLNRTHKLINLSWRRMVWDSEIFRNGMRIGLPTGFQQTFVSLGMIALFRIVNSFGTDTVAAYTVAGRLDNIAALPAMNLGQALSTFVGQNIGAGKKQRVGLGLISTLKMSAVISIVMSFIIIIFRKHLILLFVSDPAVVEIGARYLLIVGAFYIVFSSMFVVGGVMRGAGDTLIPMFITLFSLWLIRIPLAAVLSKRMGADGIWLAIPIAWVIGLVFSFIYYRTGRWKRKGVVRYVEDSQD